MPPYCVMYPRAADIEQPFGIRNAMAAGSSSLPLQPCFVSLTKIAIHGSIACT